MWVLSISGHLLLSKSHVEIEFLSPYCFTSQFLTRMNTRSEFPQSETPDHYAHSKNNNNNNSNGTPTGQLNTEAVVAAAVASFRELSESYGGGDDEDEDAGDMR